jgi:hypothetical protein
VRNTITALAAAFVLAVAGCGGDTTGEESVASAPTASPTPKTAPVEDWAALLRPHVREWGDLLKQKVEICLDSDTVDMCDDVYRSLEEKAEDIARVLTDARLKEGTPTYLGEPPDEIASLVRETVDAARQVQQAWDTYEQVDCSDSTAGDCFAATYALEGFVELLTGALDGWTPYL